jgi:hypothetical protein
VLTDPDGVAELRRLGARSIPVLSRGDDWVFAQNIAPVVKFLGLNEATGPALSPAALVERVSLFVDTATKIIPQMPDALMSKEVPNRPRTYRVLAHHIFRIPQGMVMVAGGETLTNDLLMPGVPEAMRTGADLGRYGQDVLAELSAWWATKADQTGKQVVKTYYGDQLLHEVLERTTWHCGQHVRQWFMLLEMAGVTPVTTLEPGAFKNLPMPSSVWDG